jgi:hypothetical protein
MFFPFRDSINLYIWPTVRDEDVKAYVSKSWNYTVAKML